LGIGHFVLGWLLICGGGMAWAEEPPPGADEAVVRECERAMDARPLDGFAIARRGADRLASRRPDLARRLFAAAAGRQRQQLARLSEDQVAELADVYAKQLDEPAAAEQVQRLWLEQREKSLEAGDVRKRVELAGLVLKWCADRPWAARLCKEAYRLDPEARAAADMLRDRLGYQLTDVGWVPRRPRSTRDPKPEVQVREHMTRDEVLDALGPPKRIARQILYRRYLEQWIYENPSVIVEFDCVKGQPAHVFHVYRSESTQP
jgi:hypothetical protein